MQVWLFEEKGARGGCFSDLVHGRGATCQELFAFPCPTASSQLDCAGSAIRLAGCFTAPHAMVREACCLCKQTLSKVPPAAPSSRCSGTERGVLGLPRDGADKHGAPAAAVPSAPAARSRRAVRGPAGSPRHARARQSVCVCVLLGGGEGEGVEPARRMRGGTRGRSAVGE